VSAAISGCYVGYASEWTHYSKLLVVGFVFTKSIRIQLLSGEESAGRI